MFDYMKFILFYDIFFELIDSFFQCAGDNRSNFVAHLTDCMMMVIVLKLNLVTHFPVFELNFLDDPFFD